MPLLAPSATLSPGEIGWFGHPAGTRLGPWPMTLGALPLDQVDEYGSPWNITEFTGKGSPPTAVETTQREIGHGAWIGAAWWAAKPYSITGAYEGETPEERWAAEQRLLGAVRMASTTTTLVFHEETERQTEVILNGEITIDPVGVFGFEFVLPLLAPDPFRYSTTEHDVSDVGLPTGGATGRLALPNAGTETAYPVFRVDGPVNDFTLTRADTGQVITVDNPAGPTLAAGEYMLVDTRRRRVLLNGITSKRSWMSGSWFGLAPSATTNVDFASTVLNTTARASATYRDVYV